VALGTEVLLHREWVRAAELAAVVAAAFTAAAQAADRSNEPRGQLMTAAPFPAPADLAIRGEGIDEHRVDP